jgi:hypothetical protein
MLQQVQTSSLIQDLSQVGKGQGRHHGRATGVLFLHGLRQHQPQHMNTRYASNAMQIIIQTTPNGVDLVLHHGQMLPLSLIHLTTLTILL